MKGLFLNKHSLSMPDNNKLLQVSNIVNIQLTEFVRVFYIICRQYMN